MKSLKIITSILFGSILGCGPDGSSTFPIKDGGSDVSDVNTHAEPPWINIPEGAWPQDSDSLDVNKEACAAINVELKPQIPTIELLIDQSGSMIEDFSGGTRWSILRDALINPTTGVVKSLEGTVRFGLALYQNNGSTRDSCPDLIKIPIALNNYQSIFTKYTMESPGGDTPTGESITAITPDILAITDPGSKYILLATDGEPDTCASPNPDNGQPQAVAAAKAAFAAGVGTFVLGISTDVSRTHLQDMANAGAGVQSGAIFYQATDAAALEKALLNIINGIRTCVFDLNGTVDQSKASTGVVMVDGVLVPVSDWRLNSSTQIELLGATCSGIKSGNHNISVKFPCDNVVIIPK